MSTAVCVVVIGRNEGARLERCLRSIGVEPALVAYVDSGSSDGSACLARQLGVHVLDLDLSVPFTAGRARNVGFSHLRMIHPDVSFIQFVDGDCELADGWLPAAEEFLTCNADVASVCGRRKERSPEMSVYNLLCDIEWDTPVGYADATGGDFMIRADAFASVKGFDERLIAGEEPELGYRLKTAGWRVYRLDHPMTVHDAALHRFSQWFVRNSRSGYAYAARAMLHFGDGSRYCWRENASIAFWGGVVPLVLLGLAAIGSRLAFAVASLFLFQIVRVALRSRHKLGFRTAIVNACFLHLGKVAELVGQFRLLWRWAIGSEQRIIEYK